MSLKIDQKPASRKGSLLCSVPKEAPNSPTAMQAFTFEDVEMRIVPRESIDGRTFHVSRDGTKGCNVMPNGAVRNCNATPITCSNSKYNGRRKQHYLQFKDVFGHHKPILAAHAVYLAWSGKTIPPDHQIHHLTGIVTDNCLDNLLCVSKFNEHPIADARQKALREVVPDGNLYLFSYERLRELQDPRTMSDADFQRELESIRAQDYRIDSRSTDDLMLADMSHHMET